MGEGWSDWYAKDFLTPTDTAATARSTWATTRARASAAGARLPGRGAAAALPAAASAGAGGFTYGDFGRIVDEPEIHADGEIWAQTLWDLRARDRLGRGAARRRSRARCGSRRPSRRSWTCATRSSSRRRCGGSARRCGPSSPPAAWATTPRRPGPRTSRRNRTSSPRRCRTTATISGFVQDAETGEPLVGRDGQRRRLARPHPHHRAPAASTRSTCRGAPTRA